MVPSTGGRMGMGVTGRIGFAGTETVVGVPLPPAGTGAWECGMTTGCTPPANLTGAPGAPGSDRSRRGPCQFGPWGLGMMGSGPRPTDTTAGLPAAGGRGGLNCGGGL